MDWLNDEELMRLIRPVLYIGAVSIAVAAAFADVTVSSNEQLSINLAGGAPAGVSETPVIAPNGRIVAFSSFADDLVPNDTNGNAGFNSDIFLRDLSTGTITRASVNTLSEEANRNSRNPALTPITPEGFYAVAFESDSSNLGTLQDPSVFYNVYVRFPTLGITEQVSMTENRASPFSDSTNPSMTMVRAKDGSSVVVVAFQSMATLMTEDSNTGSDIYLARIVVPASVMAGQSTSFTPFDTFSIERISRAVGHEGGVQPDADSETPKVSTDGSTVVFTSTASNLVSGLPGNGTNGYRQVYVYDVKTRQISLLSKDSAGAAGDGSSFSPNVSFNGRFVTFLTQAPNLVQGPQGEIAVLVWHDRVTGLTKIVNENEVNGVGEFEPGPGTLLQNGRFVVFADDSSNLVDGDTNAVADIFLKDMQTREITRVSRGVGGAEASAASSSPVIAQTFFNSLNASIVFGSMATNLTSPSTTSGAGDIFSTQVTFDPPPFQSGAQLNVPPDVNIRAKKLKFIAQKFTLSNPQSASATALRYEFKVTVKSTKRGRTSVSRLSQISKRNTYTLAKAKGTYTVRNRVLTVKTSTNKVVEKTTFSPRLRFTVE